MTEETTAVCYVTWCKWHINYC